MNILFLALDINLGNTTGDSIHVRELTSALGKLGNEVILIVADIPDKTSTLKWLETTSNVHLYFNKQNQRMGDISTALFCRKVAKKHQVGIIYERRTTPKIGYIQSRLLSISYVIEINALAEEEIALLREAKREFAPIKHLKNALHHHFFKNAHKIVTVTNNIKMGMINRYNLPSEKVTVIPNGANTDLFTPMNRDDCILNLDLPAEYNYICFTGNLAPWQGVEVMIDALPLILDKIPNVRFLVVGGGVQKMALQKRAEELGIENHIIFTGWVDYDKVPKYINASDICVAPLTIGREKSGSSAIKIYEYMACGRPIVASNVPNLDFLQSSGCGVLVTRDDKFELAKAITELFEDKARREKMGIIAREEAVKNYSWMNTAKNISQMLQKLL